MARSVADVSLEARDDRRGGGEIELVPRANRSVKLFLVKIGVAVAVSLAGFLFRPGSPPHPTPRTSPPDGGESKTGGKETARGLEEQHSISKSEESTGMTTYATSTTLPTNEEDLLFPESNDPLMEEPESTATDLEMAKLDKETAVEQEIASLRELVLSLRERERALELQLLGYHGAKEQEVSVRELENRLKISATETKLYMVKMESFKAENRKLQAQLVDHARVVSELEAARAQIEHLTTNMKSDGERAKEIIASLQQRIASLQQREEKATKHDSKLEMNLKRLEGEVRELRNANSRLSEEKLDLESKLEGAQVEATEEANRHTMTMNEQLIEEVDRLRNDRCADVEELVYLRWVNACLRYELRNYQPPQGRAAARDLSKCLSPKSEANAKQLILEYANSGADDKSSSLFEVDSECSSSSSQASTTGEHEDSDKKVKFLSKLKKLAVGKVKRKNKVSSDFDGTQSSRDSERRASFSVCSVDDAIGRGSYDSSPSCVVERHNKDRNYSRFSLDIEMLLKLDPEEARDEEIQLLKEILLNNGREDSSYFPEKTEIKKFADALMRSSRERSKTHERSASFT